MKIDFTAEQAQFVASFMAAHAEHGRRQASEMLAQSVAADGLARKVTAGSVDLDEAEIRVLQTFLSSLGIITGMAPGMLKEGAKEQLEELIPRIASAKRKHDH